MINYTAPDRLIGGQIMAVSGPLARSIKDLEIGLEAMSMENYDDTWWTPIDLKLPKLEKTIALVTRIKGLITEKSVTEKFNKSSKLENLGWKIEGLGARFSRTSTYQAVLWLAEFRRTSATVIQAENDLSQCLFSNK